MNYSADRTRANAADPRLIATRAALIGSFIRLMAATGAAPTVRDLARAAMVSRSAFYRHFSGLDQLASAVFTSMLEQIGDTAAPDSPDQDAAPRTVTPRYLAAFVDDVLTHQELYRAMLHSELSARIRPELIEICARFLRRPMQATAPPGTDLHDLSLFCAAGILSLVEAWLREEPPMNATTMTTRMLAVLPAWLVTTGDRQAATGDRRRTPGNERSSDSG